MNKFNTDFLEQYRNGNRARLIVSLATKDERMTKGELTEILTGDFGDKLSYRRAMHHKNAPATLTKKLSRDGEFLHCKCMAYHWDEATADELHVGAKWMIENEPSGHSASCYAENPNTSAKTLKYLYSNCEDEGYLWESLIMNPNTPEDTKNNVQKRMNKFQILKINNKIAVLKADAVQLRSV